MKIEEGKYYRARYERKVGPMIPWPSGGLWQELGRGGLWLDDGRSQYPWMADSPQLISEWADDDDTTPTDDYAALRTILNDAYTQAASGKGKERHANDRPFLQQPICEIGRMLGSVCDGELYQAIKKAQEASNMLERGDHGKAEHELLGAINYLAAAVILIREQKTHNGITRKC